MRPFASAVYSNVEQIGRHKNAALHIPFASVSLKGQKLGDGKKCKDADVTALILPPTYQQLPAGLNTNEHSCAPAAGQSPHGNLNPAQKFIPVHLQ